MRKGIVFLIIISIILSGCGWKSNKSLEPFNELQDLQFAEWKLPEYFIPKRIHVVGLGDSLTEGMGDERLRGGYFGRITEKMNSWKGVKEVTVSNLAKRGRKSSQLIDSFDEKQVQSTLMEADVIFLTIGGNDMMEIVKRHIFNLTLEPFYRGLKTFDSRLSEIFGTIRSLNSEAMIVVIGLYNPFSIVTDDVKEFDEIVEVWNKTIEMYSVLDGKSCFVPVNDLFDSNATMVYHTDFFHPNAFGYEEMTNRILKEISECGLEKLSDGNLEL